MIIIPPVDYSMFYEWMELQTTNMAKSFAVLNLNVRI